MKKLIIIFAIASSAVLYSLPERQKRVTCYARANLYVYDQHGSHAGTGSSIGAAVSQALKNCGAQHIFGCIPIPGCGAAQK